MCGAYALLNAVGYVNSLTYGETRHLFRGLCNEAQVIAPTALYNGLWFRELKALSRTVNEWLADENRIRISLPMQRKYESVEDFAFDLGQRINNDDKCAILSLGEPWHHWSVVHRVNKKSFSMLDSANKKLTYLRFERLCVKSTEGKTLIHPRQTFIFESDA